MKVRNFVIRYKDTHASLIPISKRTTVFSLDLETDYASGQTNALESMSLLLAFLCEHKVPLTVFVEGSLFYSHSHLIKKIADLGADVQLHCNDHQIRGRYPKVDGKFS